MSSLVVSRLTIARLGEAGYGGYALIVGFAGFLACADLGLLPGLTRGTACYFAARERRAIVDILQRMDRLIRRFSLALTSAGVLLILWSSGGLIPSIVHAFIVFALASMLSIHTEVRTALLRAAGGIVPSYQLRMASSLIYVCGVVGLYCGLPVWPGVWVICYVQLIAGYIYFRLVQTRLMHTLPPTSDSAGEAYTPPRAFWTEARRISVPDRISRTTQLVIGAIERPLLVATSGLAFVTSYDLLLRLTLLVSLVPGALSQPLVAMLSYDAARQEHERNFGNSLRMTRLMAGICTATGLVTAILLWTRFHYQIFGVRSRVPLLVGLLIVSVAAVNVLTAPAVAALTTQGVVKPTTTKVYIEACGVVAGGILAWVFHDGLVFVIVRHCAIGVSAMWFLVVSHNHLPGSNI
jgi:hypothetical protein